MLFPLALCVVAVLPDFGPAQRLVDLEPTPRGLQFELLGVDENGALLTGDAHLWWYPIDGATIDLGRAATRARRLGSRFIVLEGFTARAVDPTTSPPTVTELLTRNFELKLADARSTDAVWLFDDDSVWVTDGTREGTKVVVPSTGTGAVMQFVLEANHRLGAWVSGQFIIWDANGTLVSVQNNVFTVSASPNGFIFGGAGLTSESGPLFDGLCFAIRDGPWANCSGGTGLTSVLFTDGTDAGTQLRDLVSGSFEEVASTATRLVYRTNFGTRLLTQPGAEALRMSEACSPRTLENRIENDNLVCFGGILPLDGGAFVPIPGLRRAIARNPEELVVQTETGLLLTDGTPDAGRVLGDARSTESSFPLLLTANGTTALYATLDAGTFLTDGTPEGTTRVGTSARRWGSGALGFTDGIASGFDDHARPVTLPAGVVGATLDWALGIDGCSAFRVDPAAKRASLKAPRCAREVLPFDDAAYLVLDDGSVMLIRPPFEPVALGSNVDVTTTPRCGPNRCWVVSKPNARDGTLEFRSVVMKTGKVELEERPTLDETFELRAATDELLVSISRVSGMPRIKVRGQAATMSTPSFRAPNVFVASTAAETIIITSGERSLVRITREGTVSSVPLDCEVRELVATDDTFFMSCGRSGSGSSRLLQLRGEEFTETPLGGEGVFGLTAESSFVFFVSNGLTAGDATRRVSLSKLPRIGELGRVRAGLVFSALDENGDVEPWVVPFSRPQPAKTCGCSSLEGALLLLSLAVLRRRRAAR